MAERKTVLGATLLGTGPAFGIAAVTIVTTAPHAGWSDPAIVILLAGCVLAVIAGVLLLAEWPSARFVARHTPILRNGRPPKWRDRTDLTPKQVDRLKALEHEREGYVARGLPGRVRQVDEQIRLTRDQRSSNQPATNTNDESSRPPIDRPPTTKGGSIRAGGDIEAGGDIRAAGSIQAGLALNHPKESPGATYRTLREEGRQFVRVISLSKQEGAIRISFAKVQRISLGPQVAGWASRLSEQLETDRLPLRYRIRVQQLESFSPLIANDDQLADVLEANLAVIDAVLLERYGEP
ncbi:MAG: hypothetical protein WBQ14_02175 [Gaiellaceae bacterium]